ncbi:type VII secretion-associated serine protease mycosin [Micromonospora sp. DR5-3]|uniref:type VII secretion-associated serine protease mycosin n=1 Tax=unclassified Micromonospora TaxID=2617518 RepID=UPI0011D752C9|nr:MULTISPECIES: type VII secretion-associated serine protease mycosin [unclassified Micromonospora]MCW3816840.1 type VII secretion-associated serine protease mycosin [Micromonospora sp. DR5-3]TYC23739.1 type VII secretion-associated serine protease mycosin [Micromonospora sp. MP36]
MRLNVGALRPVTAGLLAGLLLVAAAAQPASAVPRRAEQWYLDELRIDQVHKVSTGRGVIVGLVDSGVDATHPDIAGRVLPGGRSYGASGDGRSDAAGHGTHMAGIIAATNASRDGVIGIAPDAKILPIKTKRAKEAYTEAASAQGIRMAVDGGAKVINLSYGAQGGASAEEESAVKYALEKDVVVVAAAGNTARGDVDVSTPAKIRGVIAVTGTTRGGGFWSGSVQGPEAVVSAPGDSIYNIGPEHGYGWGDGTSDASAIVSGLAALIRSKYPDLDAPNVINRIIRTARDAGPPGRDPQYGFGRIDAVAALTADVPAVSANPLLEPAAAASQPPGQAAEDDNFDVTKYGDRGGPTDQQVMVIGIGIAVVLVVLLALAIFLIWNRRRYRRDAARAAAVPDDLLDGVPPGGGYAPPVPAGYHPPGAPPAPGYPAPGGTPAPGGYAPPPGHVPPPGPPGTYPPPGGGNRS